MDENFENQNFKKVFEQIKGKENGISMLAVNMIWTNLSDENVDYILEETKNDLEEQVEVIKWMGTGNKNLVKKHLKCTKITLKYNLNFGEK